VGSEKGEDKGREGGDSRRGGRGGGGMEGERWWAVVGGGCGKEINRFGEGKGGFFVWSGLFCLCLSPPPARRVRWRWYRYSSKVEKRAEATCREVKVAK
jgi:hypothetical protein